MANILAVLLVLTSGFVSGGMLQAQTSNTTNQDAGPVPNALNVRDLGAKGDGVTDDAPAINSAIQQAINSGATAIHIPAGNYLLDTSTVHIENATGLTVYGDGAGTVLTAKNGMDQVLHVDHCTNVTVRNLVLDRASYYFTQGVVDSVDHTAKTANVTLDPGYPEANAPVIDKITGFRPFTYPDAGVYQQDHYISTIKGREQIGDHKWKLDLPDRGVEDDWVGKRFIIWSDTQAGHGISASGDTDCLFQDITYYGRGANAGFLIGGSRGTMTMRRCNIDVPPGSNGMLSCSGGGQFVNIRGKLVFDHCSFLKFDDDGADIMTTYVRILQQPAPDTLVLEHDNSFEVGDTLAIMNWQIKAERGTAKIVSVDKGPGANCTVKLDQSVTVGNMGPGNGEHRGIPQISDGIDRAVDYNNVTSSTEFHNCTFQCMRARPLNLKAQNCLVDSCTFFDCEMPAIAAGPEMYWQEAPAIHNLTVSNCQFTNCDTTNIDVDYFDADANTTDSYDNQNIVIEGNTFKHYGAYPTVHHYISGCAVHVRYATNVTIKNNNFADPAPTAPPGTPRVLIQHCKNVTVEDNQGLPPDALKQE